MSRSRNQKSCGRNCPVCARPDLRKLEREEGRFARLMMELEWLESCRPDRHRCSDGVFEI